MTTFIMGTVHSLKSDIKTKNKLYRIYKKHETGFNKNKYIQFKNKLTATLRIKEKEYYQTLLSHHKNNLKKTWSVIKSVISNCKHTKINDTFISGESVITDKNIIANKFNDYFVNIGASLAEKNPKIGTFIWKIFTWSKQGIYIYYPN